ncbi:MAG: AbrB/MazE/SpoVT family DNA-binding domain-containing protein [Clostridia bacterium]|nr:AbrB/MazE/SpoVT family DNA-binding domain-containing protein [Clostridia bacterium]
MSDGKYLFGICKVNEKGQIVIPKQARDVFGIKMGDSLVLLGDKKKGMALVKAETFTDTIDDVLKED